MKGKVFGLAVAFVLALSGYALAHCGTCGVGDDEHGHSKEGAHAVTAAEAAAPAAVVEVGNQICPVEGGEIGSMGEPAQVVYNGKKYNFCCADCIGEFNKDPEKYIKSLEEKTKE